MTGRLNSAAGMTLFLCLPAKLLSTLICAEYILKLRCYFDEYGQYIRIEMLDSGPSVIRTDRIFFADFMSPVFTNPLYFLSLCICPKLESFFAVIM